MAASEFAMASREHAARLQSLIDKSGVRRLKAIYDTANAELELRLAKLVGRGTSPYTMQQHRAMITQVRQGQAQIAKHMAVALGQSTTMAQNAAMNAVIKDIKKLQMQTTGSFVTLPIEQASKFAGVVDKKKTSLLKHHGKLGAKHTAGAVSRMEQALAQSLIQGESGMAAIGRVQAASAMEWHKAERIVRTEVAWAYNATQVDAVTESSKVFGDMMMRWSELVTDVTLQKLDDRVGDDSVAMHGQLAKTGAFFTMPAQTPPGLKISQGLRGGMWAHPPNRPNDRAVLQPWRPGWAWGYELVGGQKVFRK